MASTQMISLYTTLVLLAVTYSTWSLRFTEEDGSLVCNGTGMTLQVNFTKFNSHGRPFKIHFQNTVDPACSVSYNSTENLIGDQLQIHASFNSCDITKTDLSNGNFLYNQTVLLTYGKNPSSQLIYREEVIKFEVECTKLSNSTVYLESMGHLNVTRLAEQTFTKVGNSTFDIVFKRKTNNSFIKTELSSALILGETMYFELELKSQRNDLKMSPQTCYATNARNSNEKYFLIENRCSNPADGTVKISTGTSTNQLFHWEAKSFRFFESSDAVYFACDVVVCESSNSAQVCERCPSWPLRKRRDVESSDSNGQVQSAMTVASPLFVLIDAPSHADETYPVEGNPNQYDTPDEEDNGFLTGTKGTVILILIICLVIVLLFFITKTTLRSRHSLSSTKATNIPLNEKL